MKCQKCGADLAENSKFCEFCGNPVSQPEQVNSNMNNNNVDLGQTVRIDPIDPNQQNNMNQEVQNNQMNNATPTQNKKNNKLLFIIGGAVLAVVAIVIAVFAFMGSSGNSVETLEKAIANFQEKANNSATIDVKLSMAAGTGESFAISATAKFQKTGDKSANLLLKVNESMLFDEMNIYASISEKEATAYVESTLLDMMGTTSSLTPMWLYYTLPLEGLTTEETTSKIEELTLKDILDKDHFVYVDKKDGLKHYQLIIDQKLIENMQKAVEKVAPEEISGATETVEPLTETLKIDFYITDTNELKKIELNMSEFLEDASVSELIFSIEFSDLNNTVVEIPADAKNSTMTIDAYMSEYAVIEDDFGFGTDFGFDSDPDGGFDNELDFDNDWDYDYESDWDTSYDWDYEDSYDSGTGFGV